MNASRTKLRYEKPAKIWNEAIPLGNGMLGAMIFGGIDEERIDLNLDTLWSGTGRDKGSKSEVKDWEEIKARIRNKDYLKAQEILKEQILGDWTESYLPLGTLRIKGPLTKDVTDYERSLDLEKAIFHAHYTSQDVRYEKEAFCSFNDKVFVLKLKSSKPCMNLEIEVETPLKETDRQVYANGILLSGRAPSYVAPNYFSCEEPVRYEENKGLSFGIGLEVKTTGQVKIGARGIQIVGADEVILMVSAADNFNEPKEGDALACCRALLTKALQKDYEELRKVHEAIYLKQFETVELRLGQDEVTLPTDERLRGFNKSPQQDVALVALMFNFGRYLLISASSKGSMAANLQGIWNSEVRPPWSSNYTLNINTQMNYWPAETTHLSSCHKPLIELIKRLSVTGRKVAKELYGLEGWVSHHNTDLWAHATPVGAYEKNCDPVCYAFWPMSSGWLCRHLWEHYLFNQDKDFLEKEAYIIIEEAVRFYLGYLEEENGYKVTIPSTSPENCFKDETGRSFSVAIGATMDLAILKELFEIYVKMCLVLEKQGDLLEDVKEVAALLPPYQIGKHGQLQEWLMDFEEVDMHHRHISHLYGLYPGDQIDPTATPELARACERTLERRGDAGTGWSLAWKLNLWARLKNGDRAFECIKKQLHLTENGEVCMHGGGTYPNLFCAHPPFQIDGNFGFVSGVAELLLQSHKDVIELLPAVPKAWQEGEVKGLKARGGFTVGVSWKDCVVNKVTIRAMEDSDCTLLIHQKHYSITCKKEEEVTLYLGGNK